MKTPREKYMNDPEYHQLVTMFEAFIDRAQFTPSEIREAAILACINCEMRRRDHRIVVDPKVGDALKTLDELFANKRYKDGEPCGHPGFLHHVTHPCEGCGRKGGRS